MAFSNDRWRLFRDVGPWRAWYYEAAGDTVTATGYFAEKWQDLRVNDLLYVETTSDVPQYRVSAVGPQSVTITSYGSGGGGGLNDGDYGDVTVGGSGTTMAINAGAVDLAMLSTDFTTAGKALLDDADAAAQRTTLGLGTIATQAASSVTITGGSVTGITDITAADGGTGRSTHTAYAVICGGTTTTAAQQSIASVGTAGQVLTSNGAGALPTMQDPAGTSDAELLAIAGLTSAADRLPYFTGSGTASLATFTSAGRALVDDADAAAQRTTLGIATTSLSANQFQAVDSAGTSAEARTDKVVVTVFLPITGNVSAGTADGQIGMWGNKPTTLTSVRTRTLGGTCDLQIRKAGSAFAAYSSAIGQTTSVTGTTSTEALASDNVIDVVVTNASSLTGLFITFLGARTAN